MTDQHRCISTEIPLVIDFIRYYTKHESTNLLPLTGVGGRLSLDPEILNPEADFPELVTITFLSLP